VPSTDQSKPAVRDAAAATQPKTYSTPVLVTYGAVAALTGGMSNMAIPDMTSRTMMA
jgi:hypothetical protein